MYSFLIRSSIFILFFNTECLQPVQLSAQQTAQRVEAEEALRAGEFNRAGRMLLELVRENPADRSNYYLLAQVYYAKGKLSKCARSFGKSGRDSLQDQDAFVWGACFFSIENWKQALRGFRLVEETSRFYPYAAYYTGVVYFKLRRYYKSKSFLEKATSPRLPMRLRKNRNLLLARIEQKENQVIQSAIDSTVSESDRERINQLNTFGEEQAIAEDLYTFRSPTSESGDAGPEERSWFTFTPSVIVAQSNQLIENHALVRHQTSLTAHREAMDMSFILAHGSSESRTQKALSLRLGLGNTQFERELSTERSFSIAQTSGSFVSKDTRRLDERTMELRAELEGYFLIGSNSHLYFNGLLWSNLLDYDPSTQWNLFQGSLGLRFDVSDFFLKPYLSQASQSDQVEEARFEDFKIGLQMGFDLSDFSLQIDFSSVQVNGDIYRQRMIDRYVFLPKMFRRNRGEDSLESLSGEIKSYLPIGRLRLAVRNEEKKFSEELDFVRRDPFIPLSDFSESDLHLRADYGIEVLTGLELSAYYTYSIYKNLRQDIQLDSEVEPVQYSSTSEIDSYGLLTRLSVFDWLVMQGSFDIQELVYKSQGLLPIDNVFLSEVPDFTNRSGFTVKIQRSF